MIHEISSIPYKNLRKGDFILLKGSTRNWYHVLRVETPGRLDPGVVNVLVENVSGRKFSQSFIGDLPGYVLRVSQSFKGEVLTYPGTTQLSMVRRNHSYPRAETPSTRCGRVNGIYLCDSLIHTGNHRRAPPVFAVAG